MNTDLADTLVATLGTDRAWVWTDLASRLLATHDAGVHWAPMVRGRPWHLAPCLSAELRAHVIEFGSNMSQPFLTIGLTNHGDRTCRVSGYPGIQAFGHHLDAARHRLDIRVKDGAIYERPDPGAKLVRLQPGQTASFNIGTGMAYQGGAHPFTITRIVLTLKGLTEAIALHAEVGATAPAGKPIPVGVTAIASHRRP
jgi:hypothetical protein